MAVFTHDDTSWSRLDYQILRDGGLSLYHSEGILNEDLAWLRAEGYAIREFDCRAWRSQDDFHLGAAEILGFPEYYGRNLDAFNDCMGDIAVPENGGIAMVFRAVESAALRDRKFLWNVLDILAGISRTNLLLGRRMLVLLQSGNPKIEFPSVGAVPVTWNRREWSNCERGV